MLFDGLKTKQPVSVVLFSGLGFAHGFGTQGLLATNSFAFNAGVKLNINIHKNWDVFAEMQGTIVDETFDGQIGGTSGKRNRPLEGYAGLNIGITCKFGGRKTIFPLRVSVIFQIISNFAKGKRD